MIPKINPQLTNVLGLCLFFATVLHFGTQPQPMANAKVKVIASAPASEQLGLPVFAPVTWAPVSNAEAVAAQMPMLLAKQTQGEGAHQ